MIFSDDINNILRWEKMHTGIIVSVLIRADKRQTFFSSTLTVAAKSAYLSYSCTTRAVRVRKHRENGRTYTAYPCRRSFGSSIWITFRSGFRCDNSWLRRRYCIQCALYMLLAFRTVEQMPHDLRNINSTNRYAIQRFPLTCTTIIVHHFKHTRRWHGATARGCGDEEGENVFLKLFFSTLVNL